MHDPPTDDDTDAMIHALLIVSRILMSVSERSIKSVDENMTVPQFRCLVSVGSKGPIHLSDLAIELEVNPSTAMRMADKLSDMRHVKRSSPKDPGRSTVYELSDSGENIVRHALEYRRREFQRILGRVASPHREYLTQALEAFADAAAVPSSHA